MKIKDSTKQKARDRFNAKTSGLEMLTDFAGWDEDIEIRCTTCGFVFTRKYQAVKTQSGITCPQCRKNATKAKTEERTRIERATRKAQFDKDEEERHKQVVADRCEGFVYVGNYTGSDGTADIQCTTCGSTTTRAWTTIKQGNVRCRVCEGIERDKKKQKQEDKKKRKAVQDYFVKQAKTNTKQMEMRTCLHCGGVFFSAINAKYCSPKCSKATNNAIKKDRRLRKLMRGNRDNTISLPKVYANDNGVCYLCGEPCDWNDYEWQGETFVAGNRYPSVDHIVALHDGGTHTWDNVRLAHRRCNSIKH